MINRPAVRMGYYWAVVQWRIGDRLKAKGVEVKAADAVGAAIAAPMVLDIDRDAVYAIDILPARRTIG